MCPFSRPAECSGINFVQVRAMAPLGDAKASRRTTMLTFLNNFMPATEGAEGIDVPRDADCPSPRVPAQTRRANREFCAVLHVLMLISGLLLTWTALCFG